MNITTKFNIGDTVWTVKDNKAYSICIREIEIKVIKKYDQFSIGETKNIIFYEDNKEEKYNEYKLVGSREELINLL